MNIPALQCIKPLTYAQSFQKNVRGQWLKKQLFPVKTICSIICSIKSRNGMRRRELADTHRSDRFDGWRYVSVVIPYLGPPAVQPGWIKGLSGDVTHPLAATLEVQHKLWLSDSCCRQDMTHHPQQLGMKDFGNDFDWKESSSQNHSNNHGFNVLIDTLSHT